jgi:hypothetical protein
MDMFLQQQNQQLQAWHMNSLRLLAKCDDSRVSHGRRNSIFRVSENVLGYKKDGDANPFVAKRRKMGNECGHCVNNWSACTAQKCPHFLMEKKKDDH